MRRPALVNRIFVARVVGAIALLAMSFAMLQMRSVSASDRVRALPLPPGFTIAPEGERKRMAIAADGTVYAVVNRIHDEMQTRAVRWRASGSLEIFQPIPEKYDDVPGFRPNAEAVVGSGALPYVTISRVSDGSHLTIHFTVSRWGKDAANEWPPPDRASPAISGILTASALQ